MNIIWGDNYIDATNELIGGSGDTIIEGGTGNISDYIYISTNSNLIINNPNTYGETRFTNLFTNGNSSRNHNVKIDYFGKLQVYHPYSLSSPTVLEGWKDVESEIAGLIFGVQASVLDIIAVQGQIAGIDAQILFLQSKITGLEPFVTAINANMEAMHYGFYSQSLYEEMVQNNFTTLTNQIPSLISSFRDVAFNTRVSQFIGGLVIPAAAGSVIGFFANHLDNHNLYVTYSNALNSNTNLTPSERKQLLEPSSNIIRQNYISFNSNFCNMNLEQGFVNSNIITRQVVPYLRSNKIEIGNITTPNSAYQLEMTGDLNTNMLYINSTSLTSLLNEKQNNMSATQPMYITTSTIGLNYDSSLTKVGNNLSVVKTATAPLKWTGNDISLDFDNTLLNNSGSLGVNIAAESKWLFSGANIYNKALTNVGIGTLSSLTSKLNINGDIYTSSNINCGIKPLNFISSFTNSTLTQVTGTNEYYLQYTSNGTLILNEPCACDLLIVGAGGNGGISSSSGGGGAGEVIYFPNFPLRAGTLNINVGVSSSTVANRISSITHSSGTQISAQGGGNGGTFNFYTTSGGTVSALTPISNTNDAYITITSTTTLTLNVNCTVDVLILAGGGGGSAGGGGAGQYYYNTNLNYTAATYNITIGTGGLGKQPSVSRGDDGTDSIITRNGTEIVRCRKGGGGAPNFGLATAPSGTYGSLGGAGHDSGATYTSFPSGTVLGYLGSRSTNGISGVGTGYSSAGGGGGSYGNGQLGIDGDFYDQNNGGLGGAGGVGVLVPITGINNYYGGGGAGGTNINKSTNSQTTRPAGGLGGGGAGSLTDNSGLIAGGLNANANTGSGGGGSDFEYTSTSGNGANGLCIIRFQNYLSLMNPTSGGSGGGGAKTQTGAVSGTKFDEYKSLVLAGLNGTNTNGGNGGSGNTTYNSRYVSSITGSSLSVGLGGSGATSSSLPVVKSNYGDGGDGNGGVGFQGIVIIRFKDPTTNLHLKAIKDNANTGLIINANESSTAYQLRLYPWSDSYTQTGIATRGYSFRVHDGNNNFDLLNLFSSFGGRIGIKTKNPSAILDVNGDIACKTFSVIGNEQYGITCQIVNQHNTGEANITITAGSSGNFGGCGIAYLPSDNQGLISCSKSLKIKTGNDSANSYIYLNNTNGYVGIGKTDPVSKLEVNGTITTNTLSSGIVYVGEVQANLINSLNGNIANVNNLYCSNIEVRNAIDMKNNPINNCSFLNGGCDYARRWIMNTNEWFYDDQNRQRLYFKNDTTGSPPEHFSLYKSGSYVHVFSDKDNTQFLKMDRYDGLSTYFNVTTSTTDFLAVVEPNAQNTIQYRTVYIKFGSFTEFHRVFVDDELYINYDDFMNNYVGRVVISKGRTKHAKKEIDKDWEVLEDKDAITIDDAQPIVQLSRKRKDKRAYGIVTYRKTSDYGGRICVNGIGEGGIWVVNTNGNLENGDYLQTSNEIGYAERQAFEANGDADDIMRSYTIAKIIMDCSFELDSPYYKCEVIDSERDLRRAFVGVVYYCG